MLCVSVSGEHSTLYSRSCPCMCMAWESQWAHAVHLFIASSVGHFSLYPACSVSCKTCVKINLHSSLGVVSRSVEAASLGAGVIPCQRTRCKGCPSWTLAAEEGSSARPWPDWALLSQASMPQRAPYLLLESMPALMQSSRGGRPIATSLQSRLWTKVSDMQSNELCTVCILLPSGSACDGLPS